jgi:hypothetical protein
MAAGDAKHAVVEVNRVIYHDSRPRISGGHARGSSYLGLPVDGLRRRHPERRLSIGFMRRPSASTSAAAAHRRATPRTYHRMASLIEGAGFEIHDGIGVVKATAMPKGKRLRTLLDMIVLARKPISERSMDANLVRWGT